MKRWLAGLLAALVLAPAGAPGADGVAKVLGEVIDRADLAPAAGESARARRLWDLVWPRMARHYVEQNGLDATADEVAELAAYHREFDRKDRAQRARKLEELDQRLAAADLNAEERAWLGEFEAVLRRMARRDADTDRLPPDPARKAARLAPWIEMWKLNQALYERYGGIVALTRFGPDPHGARAAMVADYERQGLLRFLDAPLRKAVLALLNARPALVVAPAEVDFTPYWKRPIPPSYFPDEVPRQDEKRD